MPELNETGLVKYDPPPSIMQIDPTAELDLAVTVAPDLETTRHVFYVGDTIIPQRKRELDFLRGGGVEVYSRCLRRTRQSFIPRLMITPFETWNDGGRPVEFATNVEEVGPFGYGQPTAIKLPPLQDGRAYGDKFQVRALRYEKVFPGHEIDQVAGGSNPTRTAEVEIVSLRGQEWIVNGVLNSEIQAVQNAFFPETWIDPDTGKRPYKLRLARQRIEEVGRSSDYLKSIADDMLLSCEMFRLWGDAQLRTIHTQLRKMTSGEIPFAYTDMHLLLLEQLEIPRQDTTSGIPVSSGLTPDLIESLKGDPGIDRDVLMQMIAENQEQAARQTRALELLAESMAAKDEPKRRGRPPMAKEE